MSFWYTLFVQLLFVAVLEITCSDRKIVLKSAVAKVPVTRTYAGLLNSLIKVNEDRVKTLKKLYRLNSMPYGKDSLRTTIENKMLSYDEMQERLIMAVKNCLKKLKFTPNIINQNEILHNEDNLFVLPIKKHNYNKEREDEVINQFKNIRTKALRSKVSNDDSEEHNNSQNDVRDENKSTSLEKINKKASEEYGNSTQDRSYYVYRCGRARLRCFKACKEAYRYACIFHYCSTGLRNTLRSSCRSDCKTYFY